jgi:hypothetical protein
VSHRKLVASEAQILQDALNADYRDVNIRLREGEYQYDLAKTIAAFQLKLVFPDVKDLIKDLYGEDKTGDIQFVRKIQTILKKMERSEIVGILPKKNPWDLQRYALSGFRFHDIDKNDVVFAADEQTAQAQYLVATSSSVAELQKPRSFSFKAKIIGLVCLVTAFYIVSMWTLTLPIIEPLVFVVAFSVAVAGSLVLGKLFSEG